MTGVRTGLPDGWEWRTLGEVTQDVTNVDPRREPDESFSYVDISSIDNERLAVTEVKRLTGRDAPSRARRPVQPGDIVFSNVRTYLRNVARINGIPEPAIASTGFTVLRPTDEVTTDYLFRYVASDEFLELITPRQTGTQYPATSDRVVRSQPIPVPPLGQQRRIAARLEEIEARRASIADRLAAAGTIVDRLRAAIPAAACTGLLTSEWREVHTPGSWEEALHRRRASERSRLGRKYVERLTPARDVLPPVPESWAWALLPELGELGRGRSKHRPRNDPALYGGEHPFIQTGDVAAADGAVIEHTQTYNEAGLAQSRLWPAGTVCITIAANIAESAILSYPACFPDSVVGLIADPDLVLAEYVELFIRTARRNLAAFAPATAQANINLAILDRLAVPIPSLQEQREIVRLAKAALETAARIEAAIATSETTLDRVARATLNRAFRGEVVGSEEDVRRDQVTGGAGSQNCKPALRA